ncbi:nucleotide exchange factor GrpE [Buchnera aphidicola (Kurisakia onigurumii)]|uniref:nucleotide exchange factor GrpE n=1 Tax=Buchnera aphidicola TaxID=9 RepID=UPI0031B706EA
MKQHENKKNEEKILQKQEKSKEKNKKNEIKTLQNLNEYFLKLEKKIINIKMRTQAKIENIEKEKNKKIEKIKYENKKKFFKKILPIIDILEKICNKKYKLQKKNFSCIEGIKLIYKSFLKNLNKSDIFFYGEKNTQYNPNIHKIISYKKTDQVKKNHITSIIKKGYLFNKEILRISEVEVAHPNKSSNNEKNNSTKQ